MESGDLKIQHCSAYTGGAIFANHVQVHGGTMEITNCQATFGGGIYAQWSLLMLGGGLRVDGCRAEVGGALYVWNDVRQSGGELILQSCVATEKGGGLATQQYSLFDGALVLLVLHVFVFSAHSREDEHPNLIVAYFVQSFVARQPVR